MKNVASVISIAVGFSLMIWMLPYVNEFFVNEGFYYLIGKFFAMVTSLLLGGLGSLIVYCLGYILPKAISERYKSRK